MKAKKFLIISTAVSLILAIVFCVLYLRERGYTHLSYVYHVNNAHNYIRTQILDLSDDISEEEWNSHVTYLQMLNPVFLPNQGDNGKAAEVIALLGHVSYTHYRQALTVLRSLKITADTMNSPPQIVIVEGDIDTVLEELRKLQA